MTAGGPQFSATPQNPDLLRWIGIQVLLLVIAWVIGVVVRRLLASRMTMSTASATLTGLGGLWGGLLVAGWIFSSSDMWRPAMLGVAALVAAIVVVIVSLIVAYLHPRPGLEPIAEVAKRGESDSLEFKSSARWNMRAGKRDEAMETVIAKTVAAFMNSGGGTLLIGVDDDGRLIGLGPDYATLKTPDADRFELWIRDLWGQRLGTNTAALPLLDFAEASDPQEGYERQEVCRVTIPPSTRPVYLKGPKGKGEAELWVRVGNSTRRLEVADAVQYVATRWPESVRVSPLTRIRLFLTMTRHRDTPTRLPRVVERVLTERAKHEASSADGEADGE